MAEEEQSWLSKTHNACRMIDAVAMNLESIANSFLAIGMDRAGERLQTNSLNLFDATKEIRRSTGEELSNQVNKSAQMSRTILNASLAGAGVSLEDSE